MNLIRLTSLTSALLCALIILEVNAQSTQARKILYNGKIFTANTSQPTVEAIVLEGDKIIAVGDLAAVKNKWEKNSELIDLQGKFLLPGMVDSHVHAISGGRSLLTAHLADTFLEQDSLRLFADYAKKSGRGMRGDILFIQGFHSNTWAHLDMLNKLFNGKENATQAVALKGSDGHTGWVNAILLKRAGIDAAFIHGLPDAEQKYFGLTPKGEPNGLIAESGFTYIEKVMPASSVTWSDAASSGVKHLNSLGITAWMDPSAGATEDGMNNVLLQAYQEISKNNNLSAHVTCVIRADANENVIPQLDVLKTWKAQFVSNKNVSVIGFKIFADGVMEFPTQTASMSAPYKNSGLYGSQMVDPEKFKSFVVAADREKFLVHVHAIGDRAVSDALNAIETARKENGNRTIPHSITHLQCVHPKDLDRFAALNVPVCMQLLWATADIYTDELVKPYIDDVLYQSMYPAKSLLQKGTLVCGASDWPVSSANPFEAMHIAETRVGKSGVLNANEIVSRTDMLLAYTINAAKAILMGDVLGSIEVGKQADFVLVDRDLLSVPPKEVRNTSVIWTMFGGKIVYKK